MFNLTDSQIILRKTLQYGIDYWDTATVYTGSEAGIGKYLSKNPGVREKVFIVTKALGAKNAAGMEERLQASMKKMNTKYVDLYYYHDLPDPALLTDEIRDWAESAKKRNLIRVFGFSTHKNMSKCLAAAASLDWIDAIMTVYNFRLIQDPNMQAALEACYKAGIGLIAMKVQGTGPTAEWAGHTSKIETEADKKLVGHFLEQGFTEGQAKIKVVLEDKRISSACVTMQNIAVLTSNVAAVLDKTKLTKADIGVFKEYAEATCSSYCAGCADICDSTLPDALRPGRISDIMRYLMYYNSYGDKARARKLFAEIPSEVRSKLLSANYGPAEARCPQHLPIHRLVAEAISKLA